MKETKSLHAYIWNSDERMLQAALSEKVISDNDEILQKYKMRTNEEKSINRNTKVFHRQFSFQQTPDKADEES